MTSRRLIACAVVLVAGCGGGGGGGGGGGSTATPPAAADTTPPVITLTGATSLSHEQGTPFSDPGATAEDNRDGSIAVTTTGTVGAAAGTYTLTYRATDAAGNQTERTRSVVVQDTIAPVITLSGAPTMTLSVGDTFADPGASAQDQADGALNVTVSGTVDTTTAGMYTLTYTATDAAGNSDSRERTVRVEEATSAETLNVLNAGQPASTWTGGIKAFDEAIGFADCSNDGGAACPSIAWRETSDAERGAVLEVEHAASGGFAGLFVAADTPVNLQRYADGALMLDIKVIAGDDQITLKLDCVFPCTSGDQAVGAVGTGVWTTLRISVATLVSAGLDLQNVNTGLVIWASAHTDTVFRVDNVYFTNEIDGPFTPLNPSGPPPTVQYTITPFGAGSVSDTINPQSYRCVYDFGNWIYNAGVVLPGIDDCDTTTGTPSGTPTPVLPQLVGAAAVQPTAAHRWWGSVTFLGEMTIGDAADAAYITPDPIMARITNTGFRALSLPAGLTSRSDGFLYPVPDPFAEVFDGIAIANSAYPDLDAYTADHSDGSVTVEWRANTQPVMQATFVHGSPYIYLQVLAGDLQLRTLREDGGEKGVFHSDDKTLGIWTDVAGNRNHFLLTGEQATTFENTASARITARNASGAFTLTLLPHQTGTPASTTIDAFAARARNVVARVAIDYTVDRTTNNVTVQHRYLDAAGAPTDTYMGLAPLHWKRAAGITPAYQTRSARGVIKFAPGSTFSYTLPYIGALPALPSLPNTFDATTLQALVQAFIDTPSNTWNPYADAYWSGKIYSKVAELIAIADGTGMQDAATTLRTWLQAELEDWFSAERNDTLDTENYFVYDETWHTLLAMEESFASHQQLNDHHFHYGYFIRAAAEICRVEPAWCGDDAWGPMLNLLIRDYAGGRDDPLFPYLRHFDPANGFSWASGMANFARGNNNESTSEAANAYGAMVLLGMITGNDDLLERGMYLHASTAATYWEYWNNIDGYRTNGTDVDNFPPGYDRITTSIIWGDGSAFATWFSPALAHILGIQGLPSNPLIMHVAQHQDYMPDYVTLGLGESGNGLPSGLPSDQWRDLWWNLLAMTDADAAIADYESVSSYTPEVGESRAHTYHWIYTMRELGRIATGTGALTANHPAAMAFTRDGVTRYVAYNFGATDIEVIYSDGFRLTVAPGQFGVGER